MSFQVRCKRQRQPPQSLRHPFHRGLHKWYVKSFTGLAVRPSLDEPNSLSYSVCRDILGLKKSFLPHVCDEQTCSGRRSAISFKLVSLPPAHALPSFKGNSPKLVEITRDTFNNCIVFSYKNFYRVFQQSVKIFSAYFFAGAKKHL